MPTAFLITPFAAASAGEEDPADFAAVQAAIRAAADALSVDLVQANDIFAAGIVVDQIRRAIERADVVIAVCTGRNANVFYELGLADMIGHRAILVARSTTDLPFDVQHWRAQLYADRATTGDLQDRLRRAIQETLDERGQITARTDRPSPPIAVPDSRVEVLKEYLDDPSKRIRLTELVRTQAHALVEALSPEVFSQSEPEPSIELAAERMRAYERASAETISFIATAAHYAVRDQIAPFVDLLGDVANAAPEQTGRTFNLWTNLRFYPSLLLLYGAGVSAVAASRYDNLHELLTTPQVQLGFRVESERLVVAVTPNQVMQRDHARHLPFFENDRLYVPLSEHLVSLLREPLAVVVNNQQRFEDAFDRYEYLAALLSADLTAQQGGRPYFYVGRFGWLDARPSSSGSPVAQVKREIDQQGRAFPLLEVGAFGGEPDRLASAVAAVDDILRNHAY